MKTIPDAVFNEMLAITKALKDRLAPTSVRHANAMRKCALLYKKLQKLTEINNKEKSIS